MPNWRNVTLAVHFRLLLVPETEVGIIAPGSPDDFISYILVCFNHSDPVFKAVLRQCPYMLSCKSMLFP